VTRLAIDPVTRSGGHLRVELEVSSGVVADAWVSGTAYRGLERILEGRDARDAWLLAERLCGSAGTSHALASVRAVENALGLVPPPNARLVRNLLGGLALVVDEVAGFYLRQAFDWVDPPAAITADPATTSSLATSISDWPNSSASYFKAFQGRLGAILGSAQPGPFGSAAAGHPALTLSPQASLLVAAHYFEALEWRRKVLQVQTILGGRGPHPQTFLVGGMAIAPDWGGPTRPVPGEHLWDVVRNSVSPLGATGLADVDHLLGEARTFVEQVFVPDVVTVLSAYPEWSALGTGIGHYLAFGEFPADGSDRPQLLLPRGRVMDRDLGHLVEVGQTGVAETTAHAWYDDGGDAALRHPADARTEPRYSGPRPPYSSLAGADRYSWLKAPRYEDDPMEVGPLPRLLVAAAAADSSIGATLSNAAAAVGVGPAGVFSTLGRILGRALEAELIAGRLGGWLSDLRADLESGDLAMADITMWDPAVWPREAEGFALGESAQGAVGHWLAIKDGRIVRYQIVDATTWNASPRDGRGRRGAIEEALVGTPVADPDHPLEALRTIHSFDPCLACGVH